MPQAFLGANPGTTVKDALEPELLDATINNETTDGTPVQVNFPGRVIVVAEVGAIAATGALDVEVQGADNQAFDQGVVSYGHFDTITDADDSDVRVLAVHAWKPWMRASGTNGVAVDAAVRVVVRPGDWQVGDARTA